MPPDPMFEPTLVVSVLARRSGSYARVVGASQAPASSNRSLTMKPIASAEP
jgi:hypothetical protein